MITVFCQQLIKLFALLNMIATCVILCSYFSAPELNKSGQKFYGQFNTLKKKIGRTKRIYYVSKKNVLTEELFNSVETIEIARNKMKFMS